MSLPCGHPSCLRCDCCPREPRRRGPQVPPPTPPRWTPEAVLSGIRSGAPGGVFRAAEKRPALTAAAARLFGSWAAACAEAGVMTARRENERERLVRLVAAEAGKGPHRCNVERDELGRAVRVVLEFEGEGE